MLGSNFQRRLASPERAASRAQLHVFFRDVEQKYNCRVVAPHDKSTKIANVDLRAGQGDVVRSAAC